jgi:predicted DNA-binding protein (UPF0251 family)/uncharacterized ParB-like nuclease family protein
MKLTDKQAEALSLYKEGYSQRDIAKKMGVHQRVVYQHLRAVKKKYAESTDPGYLVKGKSTLYGPDGEVKIEWVKTEKEKETAQQIEAAFRSALDDIKPLPKIKKPTKNTKGSITIYPMGDPHIGMYAWKKEAGEDFDCDIAEQDLVGAMDDLVSRSYPTEQAVIINLGDFFHADGIANQTTSGTPQDVDTRWPRVLEIGLKIMIRLISRALEKHKKVTVVNAIGNHDAHSSVFLSIALRLAYEKNDRVEVLDTVSGFHYFEFGDCFFGVHHGDKVKREALPGVMAADQPEAWGRTKHRYWFTGHIHHQTRVEVNGCIIESFRTLAGKDSWHYSKGYRSGRDMYSILFDEKYGETDRFRCDITRARR